MITIVNDGLGIVGSIQNMLNKIGVESIVTSDVSTLKSAKKIILPGVGKFDAGISGINQLGLRDILNYKVLQEKIPVLGICLGMQLLAQKSQEGKLPGLGWINAEVMKFDLNNNYKVPHMGWNEVKVVNENKLVDNLDTARFYFVHSYYMYVYDCRDIVLRTHYGIEFTSAVQHENIYGVQFHPEKSHKYGMQLLKNFCEI